MKAFVSQQNSFQITHHTVAGGIYHYHSIGIWSTNLYRITQIYGLPWQLNWLGIHLQCRRPWFDSWVGKIPWRRDRLPTPVFLCFPGGSDGRESVQNEGDRGWSLCWENPLEEGMATHSSILAWRILWTEEPGGLQSMGSQKSQTRLSN